MISPLTMLLVITILTSSHPLSSYLTNLANNQSANNAPSNNNPNISSPPFVTVYLVYTTVSFLHYKIPNSSVYPYSDSSSTAAAAPTNTPTTIPTAAPSIPDNILSPPFLSSKSSLANNQSASNAPSKSNPNIFSHPFFKFLQ